MGAIEAFHLGSVAVATPDDAVQVASRVAGILADVIRRQGLAIKIREREYVKVDGWATAAALLGIMAREASVTRHPDGTWEATVELVRLRDGAVIGRGSAIVSPDEPRWAEAPEYARRSMAITRAAGKAFRLALSWIVALAGYETTPAEEVQDLDESPAASPAVQAHPVAPTRRDWSAFWGRVRGMGLTPEIAHQILKARAGFDSFAEYVKSGHSLEEAIALLEDATAGVQGGS